MKFLAMVLVLVAALAGGTALAGVPDDLQQISVTIKSGEAQGSGNLVTRKVGDDTLTFVWTAAHVVDNLRTTRTVVTASGAKKTLIEYKDAEIVQERQQGGRRVGEVKFDAKVVKVSDADYGEDLALLMVRCKNAYPLTVSTRFHLEADYIPAIGIELAHCGSLLGQFGANSYTTGVLSQTGRTLPMKGANVKVFDQVTAVAFPGSSGGGMYLKADGVYIGMLTQGVMKLQGFNFIVPVRRIHAWAKASKIEWAIDPSVEMPTLKEIEAIPVEDAASVAGSGGEPDLLQPCQHGFDFSAVRTWVEGLFTGVAK
jgi:S1-C subfamily serine protease